MNAIIQSYMINKGFGFLKPEGAADGVEYFFHVSNVTSGTPRPGAQVTFELGDPVRLGQRKQAVNVIVVLNTENVESPLDALAGSTAVQEGGK